VEDFLHGQACSLLTPEIAGAALVEPVRADAATDYLLGVGLQELP
jgi:hypothetical protein